MPNGTRELLAWCWAGGHEWTWEGNPSINAAPDNCKEHRRRLGNMLEDPRPPIKPPPGFRQRQREHNKKDVIDVLAEAKLTAKRYPFTTTMLPAGRDGANFDFLRQMDAANECIHGALPHDEVKPAECRCWVASGA